MSTEVKPEHITWVIGAGGLLGRSVSARLRSAGSLVHQERIPWSDTEASEQALFDGLANLVERARVTATRWRIAWCAGAGVTGSSESELQNEVAVFSRFLERVAGVGTVDRASLFLASSAGGVYAGSVDPPFTEQHTPRPISAYGVAKLAMEQVASQFGDSVGAPVVLGRIANLYGPAQNLAKPQGLISHICRTHLMGQPISIYVPLDTTRDYLFVDDCSAMVVDALDRVTTRDESSTVKIFASQRPTTVAALLGEFKRVFKRAPRVVLGSSPYSRFQSKDLRLKSTVWPGFDRRTLTPLPVGIAATVRALRHSVQSATVDDVRRRPSSGTRRDTNRVVGPAADTE